MFERPLLAWALTRRLNGDRRPHAHGSRFGVATTIARPLRNVRASAHIGPNTATRRGFGEKHSKARPSVALVGRYLIDTSAAARMSHPEVSRRLHALLATGVVATTAALDAEALAAAPGHDEYEKRLAEHRSAREYVPTNDEHWHTALGAQRALAKLGAHHAVDIADLLTAALASAHKLVVVHYDTCFETAAKVLTFQHRWVMPRGTI